MNILIRGKPRSGKSTLIQKIVKILSEQGKIVGGIGTPEIRDRSRLGFEIVDIMTGERGILAHVNQKEGPKISRYRVKLKDLIEVGVKAIQRAIEEKVDFIILDEIGKMELVSNEFQAVVWEALNHQKVLGSIGLISHPFISKIYQRNDLKLINLTIQNREVIFKELRNLLEI